MQVFSRCLAVKSALKKPPKTKQKQKKTKPKQPTTDNQKTNKLIKT